MRRRSYGRDAGLSLRMLFTGALLGLLYVGFALVLFSVLNVGLAPMLVIVIGIAFFQYFTSTSWPSPRPARRSSPAEEAPAARDGRAPLRDGRSAQAEDRRDGHRRRTRSRPGARPSTPRSA